MDTRTLSVERLPERRREISRGEISVVVADFQPLAAPRTLATALAAGDNDLNIRRIDVVRDLAGAYTHRTVPDLADSYALLLGPPTEPVDCVVGYCSASVLAAQIAVSLERRTSVRPPVVLVNPTRPTLRQAFDDFAGFLAKLGSPARFAERDLRPGGAGTHALMNDALRTALARLALADGMDADEVAMVETELLARFDGWLGFLLAAAAMPDPVGSDRTVIAAESNGAAGGAGGSALDDGTVRATVTGIHEVVSGEGEQR